MKKPLVDASSSGRGDPAAPAWAAESSRPHVKWLLILSRPAILWSLVALLAALAAVPIVTWRWVQRDRAELVERFSKEQLVAIRFVARDLEMDVEDVRKDLRFVVLLLQVMARGEHLRPMLVALLGTSRNYRGLVVEWRSQQPGLRIPDLHRPLPDPRRFDDEVRRTFESLTRPGSAAVVVSPLIESGTSWFRIFATSLTGRSGRVAMIVDMYQPMNRLRMAAMDPQTRLLVLGPHGTATPISDPVLRRATATAQRAPQQPGRFQALLREMRQGNKGTLRIPRAEVVLLGLGRAETIAAFHPIRMRDGGHWSVATLTSLDAIQQHENTLLLKFGMGAGTVMLLVLGLGGFLLFTSYRHAAMLERVRHAEVEAQLHEMAQKTLESIPSGVLVLSEDDVVTAVNRALRERLTAAAVGKRIPEALPAADSDAIDTIRRLLEESRRSGLLRSVVGEHLVLFGAEGHFRLHAVPLRPASSQAKMLLVVEDITELKTLEDQILRTEKLSTVGTLAAGIAHEIGTPLSVVRGRSEYILGKLEPGSPHAAGIRVVIEQSDRIIRTVRELLDYSRITPAQPSSADCTLIVGKCLELLRYEASRRQVSVTAQLEPGLPPAAANPDQLQQVIVNLLMNAIDASTPGQEVTIRAGRELTAVGSEGLEPAAKGSEGRAPTAKGSEGLEHLHLEIQDRGAGIDAAILHRIFDPFFTTKKRGQGTGLGLFITAHIVRNHGATLDLQAAPEGGTIAVLDWPVYREGSHDQAA